MITTSQLLLAFTVLFLLASCGRQTSLNATSDKDPELSSFLDKYGSNFIKKPAASRGAYGPFTSPVYNGYEGAILYGYNEGSKNICTRWDLWVTGSSNLNLVRMVRNETGDVASDIGNSVYLGSWTGYGKDGIVFNAKQDTELTVSGTVSFCHSPGMDYVSFKVPANQGFIQKTFLNGAVVVKVGSRSRVLEPKPTPTSLPENYPHYSQPPWFPGTCIPQSQYYNTAYCQPVPRNEGPECKEWLKKCEAKKPTGGQHPTYCMCVSFPF